MSDALYVYRRTTDTLFVWPDGEILPSIGQPDGDYRVLRLDPRGGSVIGYEYPYFLAAGVYHWRGLYRHMDAAGIPRRKRWRVRLMFWVYEWLWRMPE